MTLREERNEALGKRVAEAIRRRNMDAWYVSSRQEACELALSLIPDGSSIGWGGTVSVDEIGLKEQLRQRNVELVDRDLGKTPEERYQLMRQTLLCDFFLGSSNAIAEDGTLVNIDGNANRLAAYCFGPKNVILVCGINKVVKTEAEALSRARNEAAAINSRRFGGDRPCKKTGSCMNCLTPDTICCQLLTTRYSKTAGRIKVILVGEELGF